MCLSPCLWCKVSCPFSFVHSEYEPTFTFVCDECFSPTLPSFLLLMMSFDEKKYLILVCFSLSLLDVFMTNTFCALFETEFPYDKVTEIFFYTMF